MEHLPDISSMIGTLAHVDLSFNNFTVGLVVVVICSVVDICIDLC